VSAFYSHWINFATYKEFSWVDEYNPASAPNRKVTMQSSAGSLRGRLSLLACLQLR